MNTATLITSASSRRWSARTCFLPRWMMGRSASIWCVIVSVSLICWQGAPATLADDSYAQNATRLEKMTADQKDDLRRKKLRFDALGSDEQQKLRDLHGSISNDSNSKELLETVKSYNRWLATLDSSERSTLLDIKDPQQRITRIKELMQQQEERRVRDYAVNLPEEDRTAIYTWVADWASAQADGIREQVPRDF